MKAVFLAGGFAGFALAAIAGFTAGRSIDLVLRDAALGCLAGALLFRWFWSVLVKSLSDTVHLRRASAVAAAAASAAEPAPVKPAAAAAAPARRS